MLIFFYFWNKLQLFSSSKNTAYIFRFFFERAKMSQSQFYLSKICYFSLLMYAFCKLAYILICLVWKRNCFRNSKDVCTQSVCKHFTSLSFENAYCSWISLVLQMHWIFSYPTKQIVNCSSIFTQISHDNSENERWTEFAWQRHRSF